MFSYTSGFRPESGLLRFNPEVCQRLLINVYAVKSGDYMKRPFSEVSIPLSDEGPSLETSRSCLSLLYIESEYSACCFN